MSDMRLTAEVKNLTNQVNEFESKLETVMERLDALEKKKSTKGTK